jgi:putative transposase
MAKEGLPIQVACRILGCLSRAFTPGAAGRRPRVRCGTSRLTDPIQQVYAASRGVYGARRVHTELTLGRGITVSHGAVEMLNVLVSKVFG